MTTQTAAVVITPVGEPHSRADHIIVDVGAALIMLICIHGIVTALRGPRK